jgi:hypothetical protein
MSKLVLAVFAVAALGLAQSERGNIVGAVTDATGARIVQAPVSITNIATNTSTRVTTTGTGEFSAPNLGPGRYRVEVAAPGFRRFIADGITLTAGATVRVDAELQVGQASESIEVQAQAGRLSTEDAKVSTAFQNKLVDELPLVVGGAMRSVFDLVWTVPELRGNDSNMAIGGGQAGDWGATLDGLSVNTNRGARSGETNYLTPSVEALTEFAVDANGFKAEYGQAGGGLITFASKSGTNQLHGSAYDFLRNTQLDARGFFAPTRAVYKQNDFGFSLGGPVEIPKLYRGKNRTFFFIAYEGFRNRVGTNDLIQTVPTTEMYQGDFSNWVNSRNQLLAIYNPATTRANPSGVGFIRDVFPNNRIPLSSFNAVSQQILPYAKSVVPNRPGIVPGTSSYVINNYISQGGSIVSPSDKKSVKIDHNAGDNHHLSFFYNRSTYSQEAGPGGFAGLPLPLNDIEPTIYQASLFRMTYDWTISPRVFNHFSIGGNKFLNDSFSPNVGLDWKSKVCIPNSVDCNKNFPMIRFTEFSNWGQEADNGADQPSWFFRNDLSYIRGGHTMKFGVTYHSQRANGFSESTIGGKANFSFLETAVPGATSFTSGSSFASFLLGAADSGGTETNRFIEQVYPYYGFYAQDDWRVNRRLVLNLGVRYEFTRPPVEAHDQYSDFSPTTPNPAVNNYNGALVFAGTGPGRQGVRSLVPGWYGAWGPHVGLAYTLDSKTAIRAGFARSFSRVTSIVGSVHYAGFSGLYNFTSTDSGITPAFYLDKGFPSYPLPPQINPAFANNGNVDWWQGSDATRPPESYNWTFSIQREIASKFVFEGYYNATMGAHLLSGLINPNQVPMPVVNGLIGKYGAAQAISLLNSNIVSAQAVAAGIPVPYANFTNASVQTSRSVNQALRPFPQYQTINAGGGGGDKSGHSTYHAMILKLNHRLSNGLTLQWGYSLSKILTDSNNYRANAGSAQDDGNRRLEKSIGPFDQTHSVKLNTLYELPFGKGRRWLTQGIASHIAGGWRLSAVQNYLSGFPIGVSRNAPLPIFNANNRPYITTYDWRAQVDGSFDPARNRFLNAAAFPAQPNSLLGNATRFNPKVRAFPNLSENVSLGKTFALTERFRLDFRVEAFNLLNRVVFSSPTTNLNSNSFGAITSQANSPRQMQLGLKLYW